MADISLYKVDCVLTPPSKWTWATNIPGGYSLTADGKKLQKPNCHISTWITDGNHEHSWEHQWGDRQIAIWVCSWELNNTPATVLSILRGWYQQELCGKWFVLTSWQGDISLWNDVANKSKTKKRKVQEIFRQLDPFSEHIQLSSKVKDMKVTGFISADTQVLVVSVWGKIYKLIENGAS